MRAAKDRPYRLKLRQHARIRAISANSRGEHRHFRTRAARASSPRNYHECDGFSSRFSLFLYGPHGNYRCFSYAWIYN